MFIRPLCPAVAQTITLQMITRPTGVDDAIKFVWKQPDTVLKSSEKQSLNAILAHNTDVVAARYFSAPQPEVWVDTLKKLLEPTGISQCAAKFACTITKLLSVHSAVPQPFLWLEGLQNM